MSSLNQIRRRVPSGLPSIDAVPWGTHLCHFYRSRDDLAAALVPYFAAGLANDEQCLWVTADPLPADAAREALAAEVVDLEEYERRGQIEIIDYQDWYLRTEGMDADEVLDLWLQRERDALSAGRKGLRLTGNTFWLEREDWESFAAYEAAVHRAFHGRNVLALCSYSLERCTVDDVMDVLRNHELALMRRAGEWETISSATQLVAAVSATGKQAAHDHGVRFFSRERYPAEEVVRYLVDRAEENERAAAILTREHQEAVRHVMARRGLSPDAIMLVAVEDLLPVFLHDGALDRAAFFRNASTLLDELSRDGCTPRVYGEAVDVLCRKGKADQALGLERLWNELLEVRPFPLLCGYELGSFHHGSGVETCAAICASHDELAIHADERDRHVLASTLAAEVRKRMQLEERLSFLEGGASEATKRLSDLQRVTSVLSEVSGLEELAAVLEMEICPIVGASGAFIAAVAGTLELQPISCNGTLNSSAQEVASQAVESVTSLWLSESAAVQSTAPSVGPPNAALLATALGVAGRRVGALVLAFKEPQPFGSGQKAFLEDVARQLAVTLERALLFDEVQRRRREVERASEAKDEFLAMLSHELRNPLAAIRSGAEILRLSGGDERIAKVQAVLDRQSSHMAKLLDGLLDVSRIVRGKITVAKDPVDLVQVIRDVVHDRTVQQEQLEVEIVTDLGPEGVWLQGDQVRLAQIVDNLLTNALKFTAAPGTVWITVRRDANEAIVSVRDTGIGIDPALLPQIFEPFQQGSQELARTTGGLGLGLAVVKGLVELHGGTIQAKSDGTGLGAEFLIRFPLMTIGTQDPSPVPAS